MKTEDFFPGKSSRLRKGQVLIAEPFMGDENFERSVVLLCDHHQQGSFGLNLTQGTNLTLDDVLEDEIYPQVPIRLGGPVEKNTLHYVHRRPDLIPQAQAIQHGLYWSGDFEEIKRLLNTGLLSPTDIHFFIGYAGWGAGQLDAELRRNAWVATTAPTDLLFATPAENLWRQVLRNMGGAYRVLSHYPTDPRLN